MNHATPPAFDLRDIPFSYYGSWFALSPVVGNARRAEDVHLVSHQQGMHPILALRCAGARVEATASRLSWITDAGRIDAAYESADTLRLCGANLSLEIAAAAPELTPFSGTYLYRDPVDGSHVFTSYETGRRYRITLLDGSIATETGDQALGAAARALTTSMDWEIAIEEYQAGRPAYTPTDAFPVVEKRVATEFAAFADRVAPWRGENTPAGELAAYVLWSATVAPAGFLARPAVLMSKHWMDKVWSWDHCFNAIALAEGEPELAWHQFSLPFDHQDPAGALPDSVTHSEVLYNYVKPPIHGWALGLLRERLGSGAETASEETYRRLEQWTTYWLGRRAPGSPFPHYHHGNDSGWDNATSFDPARVIESADLSAFLILQMRELATLAVDLGRTQAAAHWTAEAATLLKALLDLLWTGDRFSARIVENGEAHTSDSLLDAMPIILGELLPEHVASALASRIERHVTEFGPATEPADSPHYAADGYWRGPIWAPSTLLIENGLRRAGHIGLADRISLRFRRLCETSGFAENFDAETGAGQRDLAYTWTASAYLILARDAQRRGTQSPL
ncbi:glycogen debranching protein [Actinospica sp. MGRD01-02]|uniref:Glycogen debranching protein n=1 Tax=Actinospica acidithermotolerans TaxID=2828514 RepID=A0A941IGB3_9ACTN|nr:trehalase family glycosidase [Actinospica acidithermotolerans]MBR7827235.1 glycogen debranching protein [Actinospica acidithermotolerans]